MLDYLDQLIGGGSSGCLGCTMHLEVPHEAQAKEWLASIAHNNMVITTAMEAGDISLNLYHDSQLSGLFCIGTCRCLGRLGL